MKNRIIKLLGVVALIGSTLFGIAGILFESSFTRDGLKSKKKKEKPKKKKDEEEEATGWEKYRSIFDEGATWFYSMKPETVTIESEDGLTLTGYYLPCENAKRTMVLVHGYHGSGVNDFGYISRFYYKMRSNILIIDQRAHGKSEGKYIGFGVKERYDCLRWIQYLNETYGDSLPIFLDGVSMGGATVLMTCDLNLPKNVAGIVADCGFTSPWEICRHVLRTVYHLPSFPILYFADWICRRKAHYSLKKVTTIETVKKSKVPILFVHGDTDNFVPTEMSRRNFAACDSEKQLEIVKGAGHGLSYFTDMKYCEEKIRQFLETYTRMKTI